MSHEQLPRHNTDALDTQPEKDSSPLPSPSPLPRHFSNGPPAYKSSPPSSFEPPRPLVDPNTGSVRSLSAFPIPPSHVPPPPRQQQLSIGQSSHSSSSNSHVNFPSIPRPPVSNTESADESHSPISNTQSSPPPSPSQGFRENTEYTKAQSNPNESASDTRRPLPTRTVTLPASPMSEAGQPQLNNPPGNKKGYFEDGTVNSEKHKSIERSDTSASNVSIVAAMRNRYSLDVRILHDHHTVYIPTNLTFAVWR